MKKVSSFFGGVGLEGNRLRVRESMHSSVIVILGYRLL